MTELDLGYGTRLPVDAVTETFALIGTRGAGKSSAARVLVEELHAARQTAVVLDPKGDWWGIRSNATGSGPGLTLPVFGGDHGDVPLEPTAGTLMADVIIDHALSCVLDLSAMSKTKARSFGTDFAERLYRRNRDPLMLVVDEADILIPQRQSAETARLLGAYEDIAKRGRSRGLGMTVATQRGADVAKSVLELVETLVVLKVIGPRTRKAITEWIDDKSDDPAVIRDITTSLSSLEVGRGWLYSPGWLGRLERVRFRRIRTFDSHATPRAGQARRTPTARAAVDLDALGAEIAATAEHARANDPAELRRRLAAAERELTAARAHVCPEATSTEVPVPYVPQAALDALAAVQTAVDALDGALDKAVATEIRPPAPEAPNRPAARRTPQPPAEPRNPSPRPAQGTVEPDPAPRLRSGARRILDTIAGSHPARLTQPQVATRARLKRTGGTFQTYWSNLRTAGLITQDPDGLWRATDAGFAAAGVTAGQLAQSGEQIRATWRAVLRRGAQQMLDELVAAWPEGITRDDLAARVGLEVTGGTFGTYLSNLRSNGIAVTDGATVRASDDLFPEEVP